MNKIEEKQHSNGKNSISRRNILKSLVGIPVLGFFGYSFIRNWKYQDRERYRILNKLGLDKISEPGSLKTNSGKKRDLLRIGMIGFGNRAEALARGLGFMHPAETERRKKNGTLAEWLEQEDMNIAITGICDVFNLHSGRYEYCYYWNM